jgi:hypothetical protein
MFLHIRARKTKARNTESLMQHIEKAKAQFGL